MYFLYCSSNYFRQGILKGGKYHCTVDLLFDWLKISRITTDNFCFYLQNRLIQTNQTGGQQYSDTSPFSIPCFRATMKLLYLRLLSAKIKSKNVTDCKIVLFFVGRVHLWRSKISNSFPFLDITTFLLWSANFMQLQASSKLDILFLWKEWRKYQRK